MEQFDAVEIYRLMSRYSRWMNERLLEVCASLPDAERKADRQAPFRSIHGLWNHLLLTDRIWVSRFHNTPFSATGLDQELYSDFEELRRERARTDEDIAQYVAALTPQKLNEPLHFTPMSIPTPRTYPLYRVMQHLFNHHTHHRGQMTTLLEQIGVDFGSTDLLAMPGTQL